MTDQPGTTLEGILAKRRRRRIRGAAFVLLLIAAAGAAWWRLGGREAPPAPPPPALEPPPVARAEPTPLPAPPRPAPEPAPPRRQPPPEQEAPAPAMPELDASDALVRELVGGITRHADVMTWLAPEELVRRFVAAVDAVAEGRSPAEQLGSLRPAGRFTVVDVEERVVADPEAFARYDTFTEIVVATDTHAAVGAYRKLRPLIDEAYRDLGYPDRSFDEALADAIAELLLAPVVVGEPALAPRVITYEYTDPDLEGLSAAQKQLLRLGPVNAPRIQRKLREMAAALGIPERELPITPLRQVPRADP